MQSRIFEIGHHILCAGLHSVPFARLSAECLLRSCPPDLRDRLRVYIHLDGLHTREIERACLWFAEVPQVIPRWARFGIKPKEKIPGRWHQRMVNQIVREFAWEPLICFVDADFFLADEAWWRMPADFTGDQLFAISYGMRDTRRMLFGQTVYTAIQTQLFVLWPAQYLALNDQEYSRDESSLKRLAEEFPQAEIKIDKGVDSMVVSSLRAQALGWKILDVEARIQACHVGGFSHVKPSKFNFDKPEQLEIWATRVRLMESVYEFMARRGYDGFFDPDHMKMLAETRAMASRHERIDEMVRTLPPTRSELAFEAVRRLFQN